MIPNGKEMTWEGHHLVFESEPSQCRGCFFDDKDSCPCQCDNGVWVEKNSSPWHTGTPTEEGDYLCWVKGPFGIKHGLYYNRCKYKDGNWFDDEVTSYNLKNMCFQVIAWQKVEPYKEKEDEHTD